MDKEEYFKFYFRKFEEGEKDGKIVSFDDEFYSKLKDTYVDYLPVSIHIKYLRPIFGPGKCDERSHMMFFALGNVKIVCADIKDLELLYNHSLHYWVEDEKYVYDPSLLKRFDKDLYYEIHMPSNLASSTLEEYCLSPERKNYYEEVKNTTLSDFLPGGKKRNYLNMIIPWVLNDANTSQNQEYIDDLNSYLESIQYDYDAIERKIDDEWQNLIRRINK